MSGSIPGRLNSPRLQAGLVAGVVAAVGAVTVLAGAEPAPQPATVALQTSIGRVCPAVGANPGRLAVLAQGSSAEVGGLAQTPTVLDEGVDVISDVTTPQTLNATDGAGLVAGGLSVGAAGQQAWGSCLATSTQQYLLLNGASGSELQLINPHATEALVNVSLAGPNGEIVADNLRDLRVAPNSVQTVPIGTIAGDATQIGIRVQTSAGRVLAVGVDAGSGGSELAAPAALGRNLVLPAVAPSTSSASLLLYNPNTTRTTVHVELLGPSGRFVPDGGDRITVEAGRAQRIELTPALRGEAVSVVITGEAPVVGSVVSQVGRDFAYSPSRTLAAASAPTKLAAPLLSPATLIVSNPGTEAVQLTIDWGEGQAETVAELPAGLSANWATPEGADRVIVAGSGTIVGGLVLGNTVDAGITIARLTNFDEVRSTVPIAVDPRLGG